MRVVASGSPARPSATTSDGVTVSHVLFGQRLDFDDEARVDFESAVWVPEAGERQRAHPVVPLIPGSDRRSRPVTLYCQCGHALDERPANALDKGCGRFWPVYLPDDVRCTPSDTGQP